MNHVAVTSAEDKGQTQVLVDFEKIRTNISVGSDTAAVGGISGIFAPYYITILSRKFVQLFIKYFFLFLLA